MDGWLISYLGDTYLGEQFKFSKSIKAINIVI